MLERYETGPGHHRTQALGFYYRRRFSNFSMTTATPRHSHALIRDPEYEGLIEWTLTYRRFILPAYAPVPARIKRVLQRIESESERLE